MSRSLRSLSCCSCSKPELRELQLVPVLLRLVRLNAEIIVERDVQHAADRADGVNAGGLRRAGQAAADRPHGDVGFVGDFLVSHFPSFLIADLLDLQNPAPFLPDSAGERLNAAEKRRDRVLLNHPVRGTIYLRTKKFRGET